MARSTARVSGPEALLELNENNPETTKSTSSAKARVVRVALAGLVAAALSVAGAYQLRGSDALSGALIGVTAGGAISILGVVLRERARNLVGPKAVTAILLSTLSGFLAFCALAAAAAIFFKPWAEPILLCALIVYLTTLFVSSYWEKS